MARTRQCHACRRPPWRYGLCQPCYAEYWAIRKRLAALLDRPPASARVVATGWPGGRVVRKKAADL